MSVGEAVPGGWVPEQQRSAGPGRWSSAPRRWSVAAVRERLAAVDRPVRLDPGRRGLAGIAVAVLVVAAVVGWRVAADRPRVDPVSSSRPVVTTPGVEGPGGSPSSARSPAPSGGGGPPVSGSASSGVARTVVVDVVGRVHRPGIVRLPAGARVDDAVRAAGGVLPGTDLTGLNLARVLVDGEQIAVGVPGASPDAPASPGTGGATATLGAKLDLNTATAEQLDALPGVGPVLAQRIVDWRTEHGRFDSVDQLNDVSGIGDAKFADLRGLVTV